MQASGTAKRPSLAAANDNARCDICSYRDGKNGLELIKCTSCNLYVHKQCYGMDTYLHKEFKCWACKAVGRSFQIEFKGPDGKRMELLQTSRPMTCALCNYASGVHAMHPMYDAEGKAARQLVLLGETPQLAWVHSLCAFYLSTQGLLFACSRDGTYNHDAEDDEAPEDNRPNNPELSFEPQDEIGCFLEGTAPVHHFVYYVDKSDDTHPYVPFVRAVKRQRHELKCTSCGIPDSDPTQYRIAIQCCAGNDNEHEEFRGKHNDLGEGEACSQAMHVGCAKWGPSNCRRVYYFPGNESRDPVNAVYCDLHAKDLVKKPVAAGVAADARRRPSLQATRRPSGISPTVSKRITPIDNSVLPSLARRKPTKKTKRQTSTAKATTTGSAASAAPTAPAASGAQAPAKLPRKRKHTLLDKTEAVAVSVAQRPKLTSNPRENAVRHQQLTQLRTDFYDKIVNATSKEERAQILKEKKGYWKNKLMSAGISKDEFMSIWNNCKEELRKMLTEDQSASTSNDVEHSQPRRASVSSQEPRPQQDSTQDAKRTPNQRKSAPVARAEASPEDTGVIELDSESLGSDTEDDEDDHDNSFFSGLFVGLGFNRGSQNYYNLAYERAFI